MIAMGTNRFVVVKAGHRPLLQEIKFSAMYHREARTAAYEAAAALSKLFPECDVLFSELSNRDCVVSVEADTADTEPHVRTAMQLFAAAFKK